MNISQKSSTPGSPRRAERTTALILLPILLISVFVISLLIGAANANIIDAIGALISRDFANTDFKIIFYIRLPRALGALLAGGALALSGVIIQAVLGNPMAAPNIIGTNAGAGFFVILTMAVVPEFISRLEISAFVGALLASLLIYAVSSRVGAGRVTVTLVGIAVQSILTAGINTVKTLFPDSVYDVSGFLIGGLSSVSFGSVLPAAALILPAFAVSPFLSRGLDVLTLGEEVAGGLGINPKRARLLWLVLASLLAGAAVSFCGLIGFVGLIVPHIMRKIFGSSHRFLIPASIFGGGIFLSAADSISRTVFAPYELPVGILLSLVGGPFFIFLILTDRRRQQ